MKRTGVWLLALGSVLLLGTWAQAAPANYATLEVLVVDPSGAPMQGAPVCVHTDKGDLVALTDGTGVAALDVKVTGSGPEEVVVEVLGGGSEGVPFAVARGMEEEIIILVPSFSPIWTIDETDKADET